MKSEITTLDIIKDINNKMYIPDILARERNEPIPSYDFNTHCVAHKDDSPSMRVYIEKGRGCYCFSCGKSYSPYSVMKLLTGLSPQEVIQRFVDNYGYKIPQDLKADLDYKIKNTLLSKQVNQIKPYLNQKTLTLLNKAITSDFANGNNNYTTKLYEMIINKYNPNQLW